MPPDKSQRPSFSSRSGIFTPASIRSADLESPKQQYLGDTTHTNTPDTKPHVKCVGGGGSSENRVVYCTVLTSIRGSDRFRVFGVGV